MIHSPAPAARRHSSKNTQWPNQSSTAIYKPLARFLPWYLALPPHLTGQGTKGPGFMHVKLLDYHLLTSEHPPSTCHTCPMLPVRESAHNSGVLSENSIWNFLPWEMRRGELSGTRCNGGWPATCRQLALTGKGPVFQVEARNTQHPASHRVPPLSSINHREARGK